MLRRRARTALRGLALAALAGSLLQPIGTAPTTAAARPLPALPSAATLAAEDDHGDTAAGASEILLTDGTGLVPGIIETGGDLDFFEFTAQADARVYVESALGTLPDSVLRRTDASGAVLAENDDCMGLQSCLVFQATAGQTYYLAVKAFSTGQTGSYTLRVMPHPTCLAETDHPYAESRNRERTFTVRNADPGAASTRVHFFRLGTEATFDFVRLRDASGNVLQTLHGASAAGRWSVPAPGAEVRIELTSDAIVHDYGFCVDRVASDTGSNTGTATVFTPNPVQTHGSHFQDSSPDEAFAQAAAQVSLQGLDGSGHLSGPFVDVTGNGIDFGQEPSGVAYGPDGGFSFLRSDKAFEEAMIYHHLDAAQRYVQALGFSAILNRATPAHAHYDDGCNAFYTSFNFGIHFGDCDPARGGATGAEFAEDADVIVHEYGHAILDDVVPGIFRAEGNAIHEGFADYLAATMFDDPCIGEWAVSGCIRRLDNTNRKPDHVTGEPHEDGLIWGGALWDIRTALGQGVADRLVLQGLFYVDQSVEFDDAALGIVNADQALNSGINQELLRQTFQARGILSATLQVTPEALELDLAEGATGMRTLTLSTSGSSGLAFSVSDAIPVGNAGPADGAPSAGPGSVLAGAPWLAADPTAGTLNAGQDMEITLVFSTEGLAPGVHRATVYITHTGTNTSPLTVPVSLTVVPTPTVTATPGPRRGGGGRGAGGGGGGGGGGGAAPATVPTSAAFDALNTAKVGSQSAMFTLPGGSVPGGGLVRASAEPLTLTPAGTAPGAPALAAAMNLPVPEGTLFGSSGARLDVFDAAGAPVTLLAKEATVSLRYTAADVAAAGGSVSSLRIMHFDPEARQWTLVPSNSDTATSSLVGTSARTGIFALVSALPAPRVVEPAAGTVSTDFAPLLRWTNPAGTTQYHLQVVPLGGDGPGVNLVRTVETEYQLLPPVARVGGYVMLPAMNYTWRVRTSRLTTPLGETDAGWGPWSGGSFATGTASSATIAPVSPSPGTIVSGPHPTLSWSNSDTRIFYYEVQASRDPGFGPGAFLYWELRHGGVTDPLNTYTIPAVFPLEPGRTYHWRVRPRIQGNGTPVSWSPAWTFSTPP